jgi:hypothetical protein
MGACVRVLGRGAKNRCAFISRCACSPHYAPAPREKHAHRALVLFGANDRLRDRLTEGRMLSDVLAPCGATNGRTMDATTSTLVVARMRQRLDTLDALVWHRFDAGRRHPRCDSSCPLRMTSEFTRATQTRAAAGNAERATEHDRAPRRSLRSSLVRPVMKTCACLASCQS